MTASIEVLCIDIKLNIFFYHLFAQNDNLAVCLLGKSTDLLGFSARAGWACGLSSAGCDSRHHSASSSPLCGVNTGAAIIAGNHLHALLRSKRRAKHLSQLALRPQTDRHVAM